MPAFYTDSFTDYNGRHLMVEWSEPVWTGHLKKHPELKNQENASVLVRSAVEDPSVVMEGTRPGSSELTVVYYREVGRHQHFVTYIKVVSGIRGSRRYIKTVFEETAPLDLVIQEKKYPKEFKETWRGNTNIL